MGTKSGIETDGPLVFAGEDPPGAGEDLRSAKEKGAWKILIVDDEEEVHDITRITLKDFTFKDREISLLSAYSGEEGKAVLKDESDIAIILLDVVMPEMNGKELAEAVRVKQKGIKILFMSGYTSNAIAHRGVLDDNVHFIQKPFSQAEIAAKIRELFNES